MFGCILLLALMCDAQDLWEQAPQDDNLEGIVRKVHIVYRHGHTEPIIGYPKDPHRNSPIWRYGPGELTKIGRRQAFYFGQNIRSRYQSLLPNEQAYTVVKAFSSKTTRTIMTSSLVLAGLLPPTGEDIWSNIPWQPAVTYHDDVSTTAKCPRLQQIRSKIRYKLTNEKLYYRVSLKTGKPVTNPVAMLNIYTCLEIQNQAGLALPDWARNTLSNIKREAATAFHFDLELSRLEVGRLVERITSFNASDDTIINLFCSHDTVIGALLTALNFNLTEPPNFVSALMVEFRELHGQIHVQLWYRVGPYDQLCRLYWPVCGVRCPLEELRTVLHPLIPKDWAKECELHLDGEEMWNILIFVLFFVSMLFVFVASGYGSKTYEWFYEVLSRQKRLKSPII